MSALTLLRHRLTGNYQALNDNEHVPPFLKPLRKSSDARSTLMRCGLKKGVGCLARLVFFSKTTALRRCCPTFDQKRTGPGFTA